MTDDLWFDTLAAVDAALPDERAPATLTSRTYSAVVARMADSGPLLDLRTTRQNGGHLCVFEHTVAALPVDAVRSLNPCRICHARLLGERVSRAPIFWPGCPYAEFHRG